MDVGVLEAGEHQPAGEVKHVGTGTRGFTDLIAPHRLDASGADRQGVRDRPGVVHGPDRRSGDRQVRGHRRDDSVEPGPGRADSSTPDEVAFSVPHKGPNLWNRA